MSLLQITDNHDWKDCRSFFIDNNCSDDDIQNLRKIADVKIKDLSFEDNPNLLIFPRDLNCHGDKISESNIISMNHRDEISTSNIMGFPETGLLHMQVGMGESLAKHKAGVQKEKIVWYVISMLITAIVVFSFDSITLQNIIILFVSGILFCIFFNYKESFGFFRVST